MSIIDGGMRASMRAAANQAEPTIIDGGRADHHRRRPCLGSPEPARAWSWATVPVASVARVDPRGAGARFSSTPGQASARAGAE